MGFVPDGVVEGGLHNGCFDGGDDLFAEDCSHEMSEGREM